MKVPRWLVRVSEAQQTATNEGGISEAKSICNGHRSERKGISGPPETSDGEA